MIDAGYIEWLRGTDMSDGTEVVCETRGRLDPYGGTVDMELFHIMSLGLSEKFHPATLNWAYDQGMRVSIKPLKCGGKVRIRNRTLDAEEIIDVVRGSFRHGTHALPIAAIYFTKITDVSIEIASGLPPRSGLGLSGALASALILGLCKVREVICGTKMPSFEEATIIAHYLEHTSGISLTGYQDQAASIFGGVAFYKWYHPSICFMLGEKTKWFTREELLDEREVNFLNDLVSTYYSGASHSSNVINEYQVRSMIDGTNRPIWFREAEIAIEARDATKEQDYEKLVDLLNESYEARKKMLPSFYTNEFQEAILKAVRKEGGGGKLAGAGAGGGVFTLASTTREAKRISDKCMRIVSKIPGSYRLEAKIRKIPACIKVLPSLR